MKRTTLRHSKPTALPIAWSDAGYAALQGNVADACDDRVSEDIFDVEDEHTAVDTILHGMAYRQN
jgi:hypothetical protein